MKHPVPSFRGMEKVASDSPGRISRFCINAGLLFLGVIFFALPQPNLLSATGFPIVAYFAFVPLFVLVRRVSLRASFLWGAFYGLLCYCLFTYWLGVFHPVAMYVIGIQYFLYSLVLVPLLKLADMHFPDKGFIVQWIIWIGYEYVKTLGFAGYSYGIIGYSQWSWPLVIRIAAVFGVWGVSALVVFPSAWIAAGIKPACSGVPRTWFRAFLPFARTHALSAVVWLVCLCAALAYGIVNTGDYSGDSHATLALVQPNSDPWKGGFETYRRDFNTLVRLSDEALASNPSIDLVVWPETAFIPRIDWHYRYRDDPQSWTLVSRLLEYLDTAPVPFVIGNDDAVMGPVWGGLWDRVDYNAVFVFTPGKNVIPPKPEKYHKMHLVPFTEHFPYRKAFPWIYDILVANDTHFWEKGYDPVVFSAGGLSFSTPICFEDTFGYISRTFVQNGARAIVNLTNDAWAKSIPCQYQHLSMAVFRAVENRVPLVRSTASGQTCIVLPDGTLSAMAEPFTETWLVGDVPVLSNYTETLYTVWGDVWGVLFLVCGLVLTLAGAIRSRIETGREPRSVVES